MYATHIELYFLAAIKRGTQTDFNLLWSMVSQYLVTYTI